MKILKFLNIVLITVIIASCSKVTDSVKEIGLGGRDINYQADEKVESLIIPPDLTQPNTLNAFSEVEDIADDTQVVQRLQNIEIKRDKYRRWLLVDLPPEEVWTLSKEFFRSYGFKIEKENQKIGLLETDYLEIETNVPDKSLGAIRAALSKVLQTQYGLPIADKYRIRIEPTDDPIKSEVYLTLSSIGEVVSGATRVWQPREKDVELETEMLLQLMVFLGSDRSKAISQIKSNTSANNDNVSVFIDESGYPTIIFPFEKNKSWKLLGWALDELEIDIVDRDQIERSYYINIKTEKSFFSRLIASTSIPKTYQLILKEESSSQTKLIFIDLSEENELEVINYSAKLFDQIASKF